MGLRPEALVHASQARELYRQSDHWLPFHLEPEMRPVRKQELYAHTDFRAAAGWLLSPLRAPPSDCLPHHVQSKGHGSAELFWPTRRLRSTCRGSRDRLCVSST